MGSYRLKCLPRCKEGYRAITDAARRAVEPRVRWTREPAGVYCGDAVGDPGSAWRRCMGAAHARRRDGDKRGQTNGRVQEIQGRDEEDEEGRRKRRALGGVEDAGDIVLGAEFELAG